MYRSLHPKPTRTIELDPRISSLQSLIDFFHIGLSAIARERQAYVLIAVASLAEIAIVIERDVFGHCGFSCCAFGVSVWDSDEDCPASAERCFSTPTFGGVGSLVVPGVVDDGRWGGERYRGEGQEGCDCEVHCSDGVFLFCRVYGSVSESIRFQLRAVCTDLCYIV